MPVSSYVIRCLPVDQDRVVQQLESMKGVAVGVRSVDGIAVAVESETRRSAEDMGQQLGSLRGVRDAVLVYYNMEEFGTATERKGSQ